MGLPSILAWRVADFKALGDADLRLPALTILAGANSSGKSSVIQSMLMMAQTMSRGGPIVLNGPLVRLGLPDDVVRDGQKSIQVGFDIELDPQGPGEVARQRVHVSASLAPNSSRSTLVPIAIDICDEAGNLRFSATTHRMSKADASTLNNLSGNPDMAYLRITQLLDSPTPSRMYVGFLGLTPMSLALHQDAQTIKRDMLFALRANAGTERASFELAHELGFFSGDDLRRELGLTEEPRSDEHQSSQPSRLAPREIATLSPDQLELLFERVANRRSRHEWVQVAPIFGIYGNRARIRYFREGPLEGLFVAAFDSELSVLTAIGTALEEFGNHLRYLGPLRDEPRVVHGAWDERVESLPVGIKGELTAEVLTRDRDRIIMYHDWDDRPHRATLADAVSAWCSYLGIGDHIQVLDLGKLGRGVNLKVNGADRDLTTIGVGASQLLPIIVGGLASPDDSTFLVEQPELHLHPSVQSRLADFFLFAKPRVKFVVETHSEYLITRIRRRIAERRYAPNRLQVLFAEQIGGSTVARDLTVTELGDFDEWPQGFFDAQEDDARHIVRAIARRLSEGAS